MQRSILLERIPIKLKYHRIPTIEIIERKEDGNTIIQGEHIVYIFKLYESFIWDSIDGIKSINIIAQDVFNFTKVKNEDYEYNDILETTMEFIDDLNKQLLIKYAEI